MAKKDYVPGQIAQKSPWATTLKARIATDGPTIGLSPSDITEVQGACDNVVSGVNDIDAANTAKEAAMGTANHKIHDAETIFVNILSAEKLTVLIQTTSDSILVWWVTKTVLTL